MKTCPTCGTQYGDAEMFCRQDGTILTADSSQSNTVPLYPNQSASARFTASTASPPSAPSSAPAPHHGAPSVHWASSGNSKTTVTIAGMGFFVVLVLGIFAIWRITSTNDNPGAESARKQPTNAAYPSSPTRSPSPSAASAAPASGEVVTVDSPNDGFLALKHIPKIAPQGITLVKVPHGTTLELVSCLDTYEVADARQGRWCKTSYGGYSGWVFDAFVVRRGYSAPTPDAGGTGAR